MDVHLPPFAVFKSNRASDGFSYIHTRVHYLTGLPGLGLSDQERGMVQLFDPSARTADGWLETSGFFVAKFEKVAVDEEKGAGGE